MSEVVEKQQMTALVKTALGPGNTEIASLPVPVPGSGQVLIAPRAVGICGSDLHTWRGNVSWELAVPVVLGHEVAGEIVALGEGAAPWQVGDRVVCETNGSTCGVCAMCRTGRPHHCSELKVFGAHTHGFFAERAVVGIETLHRIPEGLSYEVAAMAEPVAVSYAGLVQEGRLQLGEHVAVVGAGAIGVFAAQLARAGGAASVCIIGTTRDEHRAPLLRRLGLGELVVAGRSDISTEVLRRTRGAGADVVVDAAGASAALRTALDTATTGGRIVKIGWGPEPLDFSLDPIVGKVLSIIGSRGHGWLAWERVLSLLDARTIDVDSCIGGRYRLTDWEAGFDDMESGRNVKSVVVLDA